MRIPHALRARAGVSTGGIPWDIGTAVFDTSFSVASQDTDPRDLFIDSGGTRLYIAGNGTNAVFQYTLSTAWDISTASYIRSFGTGPDNATTLAGVFFRDNGTRMYFVGANNATVIQYTLSTAWDISTTGTKATLSLLSQDSSPQSIFFRSNGLQMYMVGSANDTVYEYSLTTAWSLATASYVQSYSVATQELTPQGLHFKSDGTKMYVVGSTSDTAYEYALSTAWNISTATYTKSFSVVAQDAFMTGIFFKTDGTKMFLTGNTNNSVYTYNL